MEEVKLIVRENIPVGKDVFLLRCSGDTKSIHHPGEFANLKLKDFYLRRPLSIHDYKEGEVSFLYKILGKGTLALSKYQKGEKIPTLLGLGNGFDTSKSKKPLLIGGGIGIAPLYCLAKELIKEGKTPSFLFGFKSKEEVFYLEEFKKLGTVLLTTDDGSLAEKGNPVSYLKNHTIDYDYYYACGPQIMLKFLTEYDKNGEVSLEERMGCGFGACMGCSIKTIDGPRRVCKEGPVFPGKEVIF